MILLCAACATCTYGLEAIFSFLT